MSDGVEQARTMVVELDHDLLIVVHTKEPPTDEEWDEYVSLSVKQVNEGGFGHRRMSRQLVLTDGGAPSLGQRKRATDAYKQAAAGEPLQTAIAIVSDSAYSRFVTTALSIVVKGIRSFSGAELDHALVYLGVADVAGARRRVERLRARLQGEGKR
ncbi:MAG: hypothetical protein U0441_08695 [Polyangiaceae bacterium]